MPVQRADQAADARTSCVVSMPVREAEAVARACAAPSRPLRATLLPARSPMPLMVTSTWRAPAREAGERVGRRQPEVVVAVHRDDRRRRCPGTFSRMPRDQRAELVGHGVADGVGDVERGRAGARSRRRAPRRGTSGSLRAGVLGRELDVGAQRCARSATISRDALEHLARASCAACASCAGREVARKVWMRGRAAPLHRLPGARRCRRASARASAADDRRLAPRRPAPTSLGDARAPPRGRRATPPGKPASMTSTPRRASARATSSFSAEVIVAPGDCSPSRSVVSKMRT